MSHPFICATNFPGRYRVDDERALDVGALRRGTGTFKVRKPKVPEGVIGIDSQGES